MADDAGVSEGEGGAIEEDLWWDETCRSSVDSISRGRCEHGRHWIQPSDTKHCLEYTFWQGTLLVTCL